MLNIGQHAEVELRNQHIDDGLEGRVNFLTKTVRVETFKHKCPDPTRIGRVLSVARESICANKNAVLYGNAYVGQDSNEVVNGQSVKGFGFVLTSERNTYLVARHIGCDQNVNFSRP